MEIIKDILAFALVVMPMAGGVGFWLVKSYRLEKSRTTTLNNAVKAHEDACNAVRCYLYERMRRDEL